MRELRLAFLGFGNVGKALARLFIKKQDELRGRHHLVFKVTGISTGKHGNAINLSGLDLESCLAAEDISQFSKRSIENTQEFIEHCAADVLFESIPVDYLTGQPAVSYLTTALEMGMAAITANKGPVVHAHRELADLAHRMGTKFFFEATVMDGAPIFSLFRESLPGANLLSFKGILNSTTNMILTRMEAGESFDQAVAHCQQIGIAETDPSGDIDGWDAAVKVAALATVLMNTPLKPAEVDRAGIRYIDRLAIENARLEGKRWKLVCTAQRASGGIQARVAPEMVGLDSPLYNVNGTDSIVQFETDVLGLLSVVESNPGPDTTAYGLFADFLNAVRVD
jgi:homoserine dehydrogenase